MSAEHLQVLVASGNATPSQGGGYVEAGRTRSAVTALGADVAKQLVNAVASLARELDGADFPTEVSSIKLGVGLVLSAEFGVSIAGIGVEGDVNVEITWQR